MIHKSNSLFAVAILLLVAAGCTKLPEAPIQKHGVNDKAVVFDIDGTLTPENRDVLVARPDAAKVAQAFADKGYHIIYLTARSTYLQASIPYWLRRHRFPQGPLHTAQSRKDNKNPLLFKVQVLNEYQRLGWQLTYAYGDSSTDFQAYAKVGIPQDHVYALRRQNDKTCQPGIFRRCLDSYTVHLPFVLGSVPSAH